MALFHSQTQHHMINIKKQGKRKLNIFIDLGVAVDHAPPRRDFGHYDSPLLHCICHKMRHISPLKSVTLPCYIKITYATLNLLKFRCQCYWSTLRHSYTLVLSLYVIQHKCVTYITSCNIHYTLLYQNYICYPKFVKFRCQCYWSTLRHSYILVFKLVCDPT